MITIDQLSGFLAMHAGFRTEFGRLAQAARAPRDHEHAALIEEQVALVLDILHAHHHHEDEVLWPFLITQQADSADVLHALEAEHVDLDRLITQVSDTSVSLPGRADALAELHDFVNRHLDHEERDAVPLLLRFMTQEMLDSDRRKATAEIGRRRIATVYPWIASCLDDQQLEKAIADLPRLVRILFRRFWWPAYQRRMTALYGPAVGPASLALATVRS